MDQHIHDQDTGRSEGNADAAFVGGGRVSDPGAGDGGRRPRPKPFRKGGWYEVTTRSHFMLSRAPIARFDIVAEAAFPPVRSRRRLAHQIRQDLWRALQGLRGFSPVVLVETTPHGVLVRAGGAVLNARGRLDRAKATIADLLDAPERRARWVRHAGGLNA